MIIIDTPGYGDTKGIAKDLQLDLKLESFFTDYSYKTLNGVFFVQKASFNRVDEQSIYIFNKIQEIWGCDIP